MFRLWKGVGILLAGLLASGCTSSDSDWLALGGDVTLSELKEKVVPFETIRSAKEGEELVVAGKVGKVCPAGCWFYLQSDDDLVYIDVLGEYEVPQSASGRKGWVVARVSGDGGSRILEATRLLVEPPDS